MSRRHRPDGLPDGTTLASLALDQLVHHCVRAVAPSGDLVVLHVPSGVYLRLDETASTIVDLLVDTGDSDQAATALAERYSIPVQRAQADVASVVDAITSLKASRSSTPRRPTASGVVATARQWWSLPTSMKAPAIWATVAVVVVEAGIRLTDVSRLARIMHVPLVAEPSDGSSPLEGTVSSVDPAVVGFDADAEAIAALSIKEQRLYVASMWVLDRWLYDGTCLRRALVTGYFLRRHGPRLRLGLIDDGETSHAWIEADGHAFNAVPVSGSFTRTWGEDGAPA